MNWPVFFEHAAIGALGASCLAALRWYQLRGELSKKKYDKMRRSLLAWAIFLGGTAASGVVAAFFFEGLKDFRAWQVFLCGAAAPAFFAQAAGAYQANRPPTVGDDFRIGDIFSSRGR
jgi:hypothetical protein